MGGPGAPVAGVLDASSGVDRERLGPLAGGVPVAAAAQGGPDEPPGLGRQGIHDTERVEDPDGSHLCAPGAGGVGDVAAGGGGQDRTLPGGDVGDDQAAGLAAAGWAEDQGRDLGWGADPAPVVTAAADPEGGRGARRRSRGPWPVPAVPPPEPAGPRQQPPAEQREDDPGDDLGDGADVDPPAEESHPGEDQQPAYGSGDDRPPAAGDGPHGGALRDGRARGVGGGCSALPRTRAWTKAPNSGMGIGSSQGASGGGCRPWWARSGSQSRWRAASPTAHQSAASLGCEPGP